MTSENNGRLSLAELAQIKIDMLKMRVKEVKRVQKTFPTGSIAHDIAHEKLGIFKKDIKSLSLIVKTAKKYNLLVQNSACAISLECDILNIDNK